MQQNVHIVLLNNLKETKMVFPTLVMEIAAILFQYWPSQLFAQARPSSHREGAARAPASQTLHTLSA